MEREIRNQKGRGKLRIPYIVPKEKIINTAKQLQEFLEEVDNDLTTVIVSSRNQQEEFKNRERARKEEAEKLRQEHLAQNNRPTGFTFHNITSTPLRGESNRTQLSDTAFHTTNQNRQTNRGVNFSPNTTCHSYTNTVETNSSNEYEQFSSDSIIQGSEMNNRTSPTNTGNSNSDPNNDWNQGHGGTYPPHTTRNTGCTGFPNKSPQYPTQRHPVTCFRYREQGHIHTSCEATDVYSNHCRTPNHSTKACKKYGNTNESPPNSNNSHRYHPTPSSTPIVQATMTQPAANGLFAPTTTSTAVQSPIPNNTLHPDTVNMTEAMTQAVQQGMSRAIGSGDVSKQMLKNLERFDGKDRSKCLEWLRRKQRNKNSSFFTLIVYDVKLNLTVYILENFSVVSLFMLY